MVIWVLCIMMMFIIKMRFQSLSWRVKIDNATPYLVETICKTRLKGGLMNREEGDDSIAPIGEVVGWIEGKILTDNCWNYAHGVPPWIDYAINLFDMPNYWCIGLGIAWGL